MPRVRLQILLSCAGVLAVTAVAWRMRSPTPFWHPTVQDRMNAAHLALHQRRPQEALRELTEALALNPVLASAYWERGILEEELDRWPAALADLSRYLQLQPQSAEAYYHRASVKHLLGQDEQALADFNRALQLKPADPAALQRRAAFFATKGQWREADADYTALLAGNPSSLPWHTLRSAVRILNEDHRGAREDLEFISEATRVPDEEMPAASEAPVNP